ncbi:TRAP transporter small permease subunit [Paenalcaligenes niemegkensis]|uniref:TRAP transporter small permease n=1 Tax=Paenalcaligenes niemegkensis TaxID=2895469 RepID=UPI001EE81379|nr:TRAP transporter small permease subunit [Paenalcaligenes niemegkensis]MCQ9617436.1 TRAP transporter small permease subunit [Paenalcaligenes niemegkensis]
MNEVQRIVHAISFGMAILSAAVIAAMPLLIGYSTVMRYFVGSALSITEELSSFLLVSCVFLGLPYAALKGRHIAISALLSILSPPLRKLMVIMTHLMTLGFLALLIKLTFDFFMLGYQLNAHSETAYIYEPPWRAVMVVSSLWLAVVVVYQLCEEIFFPQHVSNES